MTAASGSRGSGWATQGLSLFRALLRRWVAIAIVVVAFAAVALVLSEQETAKYRSSASVFLSSGSTAISGSSVDPTAVVRTQAQLAASTAAVDKVAAAMGVSHDYVASRLSASPSNAGYFFVISATDTTKTRAETMVKTAESVYQQIVASSGSGSDATQQRLEALRATTTRNLATYTAQQQNQAATLTTAQSQALSARITSAQRLLTTITSDENDNLLKSATSPSIVQLAEAPQSATQVAPKPLRNALVAVVVGLFLSAAVIWGLYLRRPTVQGGKAAADLLGVPLLAQIPGGRQASGVPTEDLVASMGSVLAPSVKVVALTPGGPTDLSPDVVAGLAASWSDEQGVVLILDAAHRTGVRGALERLPRASSMDLPRWANEPTCLARSSGRGRGHVLYSRVAPTRAARPGGLAPILADRAPVVDLVLLLTPAFAELPVTAASAMQADVVIALTSTDTPAPVLAEVMGEWPGLAERIVGLVHDGRSSYRRSARRSTALVGSHGPVLEAPDNGPGLDLDSHGSPV
ncbi:MAG: Wzz/FepE/Etk N-terminal domain-containing protein, partial [Frankia sp.]